MLHRSDALVRRSSTARDVAARNEACAILPAHVAETRRDTRRFGDDDGRRFTTVASHAESIAASVDRKVYCGKWPRTVAPLFEQRQHRDAGHVDLHPRRPPAVYRGAGSPIVRLGRYKPLETACDDRRAVGRAARESASTVLPVQRG